MSFGVSIGDFIAVGELVVKIIDTLRGAQPESQELIRELESLRRALSQIDKLKGRGIQAIAVDQIKCAALTCKYPLEDFLAKIQKYDKHLGLVKSNDKIRNVAVKVQFAFKEKNEANTLRNYLNIHIGSINMLLIRQGLEMLDVVSECIDKNHEELRVRIEDSTNELKEIRGNAQAQALAVGENNSMIRKLFWMISGDLAAPLRALSQTVAKVCLTSGWYVNKSSSVSTQQIYVIVLELRANLPGIDSRFTHFQDPVRVEDVLGRVFCFSSECSIDSLYAEIRARFKEGHGMAEVMAGNFEIFNAKDSEQVLTTSGRSTLLPGMSVNMAIILEEFTGDDKCPMPRCLSKSFVNVIGRGRTCSECKVWFDGVSKQRKRDLKISKHIKTLADRDRNEAKRPKTLHSSFQEAGLLGDEETGENLQPDSEETSISAFKRIRFESGLQAEAAAALPDMYAQPPASSAPAVTTWPHPSSTSDTFTDDEKFARLEKLYGEQKTEHQARKPAANEAAAKEAAKEIAAAAVKRPPPPKGKDKPIKFKDAIGRTYNFPFNACNTWSGMEYLIKEAFFHVADLGPYVFNGQYDILGPKDEIIIPSIWESVIEPGWEIIMHIWPIPQPPSEGGDALAGGNN